MLSIRSGDVVNMVILFVPLRPYASLKTKIFPGYNAARGNIIDLASIRVSTERQTATVESEVAICISSWYLNYRKATPTNIAPITTLPRKRADPATSSV